MSEPITITLNTDIAWGPTLQIRWAEKIDIWASNRKKTVLQQLWMGSDGSLEWRDVPTDSNP